MLSLYLCIVFHQDAIVFLIIRGSSELLNFKIISNWLLQMRTLLLWLMSELLKFVIDDILYWERNDYVWWFVICFSTGYCKNKDDYILIAYFLFTCFNKILEQRERLKFSYICILYHDNFLFQRKIKLSAKS